MWNGQLLFREAIDVDDFVDVFSNCLEFCINIASSKCQQRRYCAPDLPK